MVETSGKDLLWLIPICFILGFFLTGFWFLIPLLLGAFFDESIKKNKNIKNKEFMRLLMWSVIIILVAIAIYFEIKTIIY